MLAKIKNFVKVHQADIILVIGAILISLLSFAIGYIVARQQEKEPIQFEGSRIFTNLVTNTTNTKFIRENSWYIRVNSREV